MHGALVVIEKNNKGERFIEEAIQSGIRLFQRHSGNFLALENMAWVHPRLYEEQGLANKQFSIDVDQDEDVPYGTVWVCRKEKDE